MKVSFASRKPKWGELLIISGILESGGNLWKRTEGRVDPAANLDEIWAKRGKLVGLQCRSADEKA